MTPGGGSPSNPTKLTKLRPLSRGSRARNAANATSLRARTRVYARVGSASGNTTKRRITPPYFENLQIPLPSLEEQRALLAAWRGAFDKVEGLDAQAEAAHREGAQAFAEALGLVSPPPVPEKPAFIARFNDLDRWSHEAMLRRTTGPGVPSPNYPVVSLGDVIADLENGWSPKCLDRPAQVDEWGV